MMPRAQKKYTSPILISLLHLLPSLLLLSMVVIGLFSLSWDERKTILGSQTSLPQIKTETVEDRLRELSGLGEKVKSESIIRAEKELTR